MKFHWLQRHSKSPSELKNTLIKINEVGYESVLVTFNTGMLDPFTKCANAFIPNQKVKFMVAIRPYALTPAYLLMILKTFEKISKDSIVLNIVPGTADKEQFIFEEGTSLHERKVYAGKFVEKMKNINDKHKFLTNDMPKIFFSGGSDENISNAVKYGDGLIYLLKDHLTSPERFNILKGTHMINLFVIICETENEAKKIYDKVDGPLVGSSIYGTKEQVKEKLLELKDFEVLLSSPGIYDCDEAIHDLVKEISK
jgi:alkanesulfonate monooxygenase SsuD/methylene tetrahydromethanopterin reductase-like flavin-dependent oxidoreductase (luciferase family)